MTSVRSQHENKFDRQMRLWGGHGQACLESAHVCVLDSGPTASETLKNLVLPNIGQFTIVDDATVTEADVGNNYFVSASDVGQSRAEAVLRMMHEMNPDVKGNFINHSPTAAINNNIQAFAAYSAVIACQMSEQPLRKLAAFLYDRNIPLIVVRSYGLIGYCRLQIYEHCVIESHPNNDRYDLYCHPMQLALWSELQSFVQSFTFKPKPSEAREAQVDNAAPINVDDDGPVTHADSSATLAADTTMQCADNGQSLNSDGLDSELHAHIPYIAILNEAMTRWHSQHRSIPQTYDQKRSFKQSIIDLAWDFANETNFNEAVEFAHRCYDLPTLDRETQAVLNDSKASALTAESAPFWLCVAALKAFMTSEGGGVCLPVSQDIPDMHSKTDWYVTLKTIFRAKSDSDAQAVINHVRAFEKQVGAKQALDEEYIRHFVRHCRELRVIRTRSLEQEYSGDATNIPPAMTSDTADDGSESSLFFTHKVNEILEEAEFDAMDAEAADSNTDEPNIPNPPIIHWYLALRACDRYYNQHGRYPGLLSVKEESVIDHPQDVSLTDSTWESEGQQVAALLAALMAERGITAKAELDCAMELARCGACEPHIIAAFMGGMGAQVTLKVLLQQYVPLNHTLLYNGIHEEAKTFNL